MNDDVTIKILSIAEINNINVIVINIIKNNFIKLNEKHKLILQKYLFKLIIIFSIYFYNENLVDQLNMNNNQDIFGLLILLLPYYDLNKSKDIIDLEELIINKNLDSQKKLECTYYIDHDRGNNNNENIDIDEYFNNILKSISNSFSQTKNKILPNWINIFPYTIDNFKNTLIYKNFCYLKDNSLFKIYDKYFWKNLENNFDDPTSIYNILSNKFIPNYFILGYDTLYGTIHNFLYMDIKDIKWMIFDKIIDNKTLPIIIILADYLKIHDISKKKYKDIENKYELKNKWLELINNNNYFDVIKYVVLFYLRYEKDQEVLKNININELCKKYIKTNFIDNENNDDLDEKFIYNKDISNECINMIANNINFENIYNYIYSCIQQFKYTWYGYKCMNDEKNLLDSNSFLINHLSSTTVYNNKTRFKYNFESFNFTFFKKNITYITLKNIYNYFKALLHIEIVINNNKEYKLMNNSPKWDNLNDKYKDIFIEKLDYSRAINNRTPKWFNITQNIKRVFIDMNNDDVQDYNNIIFLNIFYYCFIDIIFETLIYNGILTYFEYNNSLTNLNEIPDKNKEYKKWEKYILDKIDLKKYNNAYNFLNNTKFNNYESIIYNKDLPEKKKSFELIKDSKWFNNFGANWIAQLQVYHHFIHQRVIFVTGATGAGKSTVAPVTFLYCLKIINYNNNGKVFCTVPREKPAKDNAIQIAKSFGVPFNETISIKTNIDGTENKKIDIIEQNINYIQYKYKKSTLYDLADDNYHPTLRLVTDGLLFNSIKSNYIFKKSLLNSKTNNFSYKNLFDIILVDEAHEHNVYMDLILTLSKYALYINNEITLGIISATMEDDEKTYRKYFEIIDDNWKAPLDLTFKYNKEYNYNSNLIDRRVHLSIPFGGMNFKVEEIIKIYKNSDEFTDILNILKLIYTSSNSGDILIFQAGSADIKKLISLINNTSPANTIAIPFYSDLPDSLKMIVSSIQDQESRNKFIYSKTKYTIENINEIPLDKRLPINFYKRFIIVATNIAEASITINSLKYVIDTGKQKVKIYNIDNNTEELKVINISKPNQKQRKGRVGRVTTGTIYYNYDITKLNDKVIYKINIENITDKILDLISSSNNYIINKNNDPNIINNIDLLIQEIKNQYTFINDDNINIYYDNIRIDKKNLFEIIYPKDDGGYSINELEDKDGHFYLIHPDEDLFERNDNLNIVKIKELNFKKSYINKISKIIDYNQKVTKYIDENGKLTNFGELVIKTSELFELNFSFIKIILELISYNIDSNSKVFKNIILFIIYKNNEINLFNSLKISGNADYLINCSIISDKYFNLDIDYPKEYYDKIIKKITNKNNNSDEDDKNNNSDKDDKKKFDIKLVKDFLISIINFSKFKDNEKNIFIILSNFYYYKILFNIITKKIKIDNNKDYNKINIELNEKPKDKVFRILQVLNEYEKICYFIINNFPLNILIKIPTVNYYIKYYKPDINNIYKLKSYISYKKLKIDTKVPNNLRNYIIFYFKENNDNSFNNILWVPINVLKLCNEYNNYLFETNFKVSMDYMSLIYNKDEINFIFKNLNEINKFIVKLDNNYKNKNYI